jgi:hypothetical protein
MLTLGPEAPALVEKVIAANLVFEHMRGRVHLDMHRSPQCDRFCGFSGAAIR